jgi:hypothetical protein
LFGEKKRIDSNEKITVLYTILTVESLKYLSLYNTKVVVVQLIVVARLFDKAVVDCQLELQKQVVDYYMDK